MTADDIIPTGYLCLQDVVQEGAEHWFPAELAASILTPQEEESIEAWKHIRKLKSAGTRGPSEYSADDHAIRKLKVKRASRAIWIDQAWHRVKQALGNGSISAVVLKERTGDFIPVPKAFWQTPREASDESLATVQFQSAKGPIRGRPVIANSDIDQLLKRSRQKNVLLSSRKARGAPKSDAVKAALLKMYPNGIPRSFPFKEALNRLSNEQLSVSETTLKRVIRKQRHVQDK